MAFLQASASVVLLCLYRTVTLSGGGGEQTWPTSFSLLSAFLNTSFGHLCRSCNEPVQLPRHQSRQSCPVSPWLDLSPCTTFLRTQFSPDVRPNCARPCGLSSFASEDTLEYPARAC